ncbi:MAG: FAD-binding oxidoreductase, partial [Acidimicrobiales bacterium]|nr:FAD-binding oxidoreductase [Acidimicrobiales bacterium]
MRPASVDEVSGVLDLCNDHGTAVVPQGGNTGLVGGSVPLAGELVLDLRRLQRLDPVDRTDRRVVVGAGVTLGDLQRAAADAG